MTTTTPTDLPEALRLAIADAVGIMRTYQTNLGSSQDTCNESGARMWAEIDRTCAALAAPTTEQSSEVAQASPLHVDRATVIEWLDANDIEVTDRQLSDLFPAAVQPQAGAESYPPMPNLEHTVRRIRRCENEAAAMVVFGYALRQFADATAALRARGAVPSGWAQGVEAVAKMLAKKADGFAEVHGYDDMGGLSFGRGAHAEAKMDWHSGLIELEEEVRAMLAAAPQPPAALSGEQDAVLLRALDAFERKERGIPQAHIAASLVAELREAMAAAKGRTDGGKPA